MAYTLLYGTMNVLERHRGVCHACSENWDLPSAYLKSFLFFKSCVEVSVISSYIIFVAVCACQFINPLLVIFVEMFNFISDFIVQFVVCFESYFYIFLIYCLIVVASLVDLLPVYMSAVHLLGLLVYIFDSAFI